MQQYIGPISDQHRHKIDCIRNQPNMADNVADKCLCVCVAVAQHVTDKEQSWQCRQLCAAGKSVVVKGEEGGKRWGGGAD